MTHYVAEDGPFARAFAARKFTVPYYDRVGESETTRKKRKVAYTCPAARTRCGASRRCSRTVGSAISCDDCIVRYKSDCGGGMSGGWVLHRSHRMHRSSHAAIPFLLLLLSRACICDH